MNRGVFYLKLKYLCGNSALSPRYSPYVGSRFPRSLPAASAVRPESTLQVFAHAHVCIPRVSPGNSFRLHKRKPAPPAAGDGSLRPFDARGGSLPFASPAVGTHGLAIGYLQFRVRPGTSAGIARFYREVFGTEAEEVNALTDSGQKTCSLVRVTCIRPVTDCVCICCCIYIRVRGRLVEPAFGSVSFSPNYCCT